MMLLAGLAVLGAGCTNPYDPTQRAVGGGLIGAGTGATIGALAGGGRGAAVGALAGGLGGAAIGAVTTPQQPNYAGGYGAQTYQQPYQQPYQQQGYAPPSYQQQQAGGWNQPPQGGGYVSAPYPTQPPPQQGWQPPPGSYWQPQPYYAPPDAAGYYRY
jgi:hypothetical protein